MTERDNYWTSVAKKKYSRRLFLGMAASAGAGLAGLSLSGCSGEKAKPASTDTAAKAPKSGGTLQFGMYADAPDFDPHMQTNLPMLDLGTLVYNQLLKFKTGDNNKVEAWERVPDLATKFEQPDPTTYVFHLQPGVKWHDGTEFTSEDVKFSIQRIATPKAEFQRNYMFEPVSKIDTPDKVTVRCTLREPFAPFMNNASNPWNKIVPRHIVEKEGDLKKVAVGTGPFMLKEYRRDVGWTLVKNPDYFVKGRPYMDGINLHIQPDQAARLSNFRAGNIDIIDEYTPLTPEQAELVKRSNPNTIIEKYPSGSWRGLATRTDRPPFDNIKVRQAVAMTIDYDQIIATVWGGNGFRQGVLPNSMGKWAVPWEKLSLPKRDPAKAKQLLAEAGYPNGFKTTGLTTVNHPYGVDFWQVMKPLLKEVGIDMEPRVLEFAAYQTARTRGEFEMAHIGFLPYMDPDEWLYPFYHSTKGTRNAGHWADPDIDKLLDKQRMAVNETERMKVLEDIQIELAKRLWFIPIPMEYYIVGWHPYVQNHKTSYATFRMNFMDEVWLDK